MTLRGLSCGSCTWVTGEPGTWCAMAWDRRDRAFWWLWCCTWGRMHCHAEWAAFYRGQPYRRTRLFR